MEDRRDTHDAAAQCVAMFLTKLLLKCVRAWREHAVAKGTSRMSRQLAASHFTLKLLSAAWQHWLARVAHFQRKGESGAFAPRLSICATAVLCCGHCRLCDAHCGGVQPLCRRAAPGSPLATHHHDPS